MICMCVYVFGFHTISVCHWEVDIENTISCPGATSEKMFRKRPFYLSNHFLHLNFVIKDYNSIQTNLMDFNEEHSQITCDYDI